jgi:hypothetical protein
MIRKPETHRPSPPLNNLNLISAWVACLLGRMKRKIEMEDHPRAARLAVWLFNASRRCYLCYVFLAICGSTVHGDATAIPRLETGVIPSGERSQVDMQCTLEASDVEKLRVFPSGQNPIPSQCRPVCGPSPANDRQGAGQSLRRFSAEEMRTFSPGPESWPLSNAFLFNQPLKARGGTVCRTDFCKYWPV